MAQFWCTFGRGCLPFVKKELQERISPTEITEVTEGRLLFTLADKSDWRKLLGLTTIERVFYVIAARTSQESRVVADTEALVKTIDWKAAFESFEDLLDSNPDAQAPAKRKRPGRESYRISVRLRPKYFIRQTECILKACREKITEDSDKLYAPDDYEIEICVQVSWLNIFVGMPLSREPLSKRNDLKHIGLRSTIASIMANQVETEAVTGLDPMCGFATILCEASRLRPDRQWVGVDKDWETALKAAENSQLHPHVGIVCADAECLPFREGLFDCLCCDMPFGKKHSRGQDLESKYSKWLCSWKPLLRRHSLTLLTSHQLAGPLEACVRAMGTSSVLTYPLDLGCTSAVMLASRAANEATLTAVTSARSGQEIS